MYTKSWLLCLPNGLFVLIYVWYALFVGALCVIMSKQCIVSRLTNTVQKKWSNNKLQKDIGGPGITGMKHPIKPSVKKIDPIIIISINQK